MNSCELDALKFLRERLVKGKEGVFCGDLWVHLLVDKGHELTFDDYYRWILQLEAAGLIRWQSFRYHDLLAEGISVTPSGLERANKQCV